MKRILINATHPEEFRFATVQDGRLFDLDIRHSQFKSKQSNIYKGIIGSYLPSLDSVFVNFGSERHGFLPISHIDFSILGHSEEDIKQNKTNLKEVLKKGDSIMVQVEKDERDTKGAFLSMCFSIVGRSLVLLPNSTKGRGVSKTLGSDDRAQYRDIIQQLTLPEQMGVIIRTAAQGKKLSDLQHELNTIIDTYNKVLEEYKTSDAPCLLYEDEDPVYSFIRDNLNQSVDEVYIDNEEIYESVKTKMQLSMEEEISKLRHYQGGLQLFSFFKIETAVESIHNRKIKLPSGGEVIFDPTEALTSIDVNSARATSGSGIEETALQTNIEAANEIARQFRLRDIGGLVVIDFIDMNTKQNQDKIYRHMCTMIEQDTARIQLEPLTKFGLMELTRQRLRSSLLDSSYPLCPTCQGSRHVRSLESYSISTLNVIEKQASAPNTQELVVVVADTIAVYLYNEKITELAEIREKYCRVIILPSSDLLPHELEIKRIEKSKHQSSADYLVENKANRAKLLLKNNVKKQKDSRERLEKSRVRHEFEPRKTSAISKIIDAFKKIFKQSGSSRKSHKPHWQRNNQRRRPRRNPQRRRPPSE